MSICGSRDTIEILPEEFHTSDCSHVVPEHGAQVQLSLVTNVNTHLVPKRSPRLSSEREVHIRAWERMCFIW